MVRNLCYLPLAGQAFMVVSLISISYFCFPADMILHVEMILQPSRGASAHLFASGLLTPEYRD